MYNNLCAIRWIVEAMKLEYGFGHENHTSINNLSPSRIKQLLLQVVSKQPDANGMYVVRGIVNCAVLQIHYCNTFQRPVEEMFDTEYCLCFSANDVQYVFFKPE